MWWILFLSDILIPVIMIICGIMFLVKPPKSINGIYGYRTALSMSSIEAWNYAHKHSGFVTLITGSVIIIPSILCQLPFYNNEGVITETFNIVHLTILSIQVIVLILTIFPTHLALKKRFNIDGTRK